MALKILNAPGPSPEKIAGDLRAAIEASIEGASAEVRAAGPGHFELRVVASQFAGLNRVKQQQLVYAAIGDFLAGPDAPVHAIDRMECVTPEA